MSFKELLLTPPISITNIVEGKELFVKVLGVPFDATSSYRSGSRFGPNAIREAFLNIEVYSKKLGIDLEQEGLEDLGNLKFTSSVEEMLGSLAKVVREAMSDGSTVAILGGEHTLTYASYTSLPSDTTLLVFDAHLDLRDEYANLKLSHTTFLRRLVERRGAESIVHVGARAASSEEWNVMQKIGLKTVLTEDVISSDSINRLRELLTGSSSIYVSIDLDVLDPAYAPAVSNPEPAGITTHKLLELLYSLKGIKLVGFDIVELSPIYDNGTTAMVAAKLLSELLCLSLAERKSSSFK